MGFKGIATPHGFRSLASDTLYKQKFSGEAIERQLAHIEENKVKSAYLRTDFWEERTEFMQWYSDHLKERYNQALKIVNEFQAG